MRRRYLYDKNFCRDYVLWFVTFFSPIIVSGGPENDYEGWIARIKQGRINVGWTTSDMSYHPTVILEPDSSLTMSYRGHGGTFVAHKPYHNIWDTLKTLAASGGYRPRIMKHTNGTYLCVYHRNIGSGQYEVFAKKSIDRIN
ncbi:MAG: hypothetical protein ABIL22_06315 [candidate division WOR-3 bacterium]